MALRVTDSWTTSRSDVVRLCLAAFSKSQFPSWVELPILQNWKRPTAIALSIAIHAVFFSALIANGIAPTEGLHPLKNGVERTLVLFELSPPSQPPPITDKSDEGNGSQDQRQAQNDEKRNIIEPEPASEWSIGRIFIQRPSAQNISNLASEVGHLANGAGQGVGDGYGFDPYAGAAPRRRDEMPVQMADYDFGISPDPALDKEAFFAFIEMLRKRIGSTRGSTLIMANVDPTGRINDAEIRGGNANIQLKLFIRSQIIGKQLFIEGTRGLHPLPPIRV